MDPPKIPTSPSSERIDVFSQFSRGNLAGVTGTLQWGADTDSQESKGNGTPRSLGRTNDQRGTKG